jgi:transcriptional regulator with GAF, ATPase, and Fis domain
MTGESDHSAAALLHALRSVLSQVAAPSQVLKTILGQAVSQTGADRGLFAEVNRTGALSYRVLYRFQKEALSGDAGRYSRNVFARVLQTGEPVRLENAVDDPTYGTKASVQDLRLVSILCMPIKVENQIAALVHLESDRPGHFKAQHERLLGQLAELAAPALGALRVGEGVMRERDALREAGDAAREELAESREALARDWSFRRFVGRCPLVHGLEAAVRRAASTGFPVLLLGETGTGKSILARVLHHGGPRSKNAFVTVFCPALEKGMVETELFGHKRGAFTGAVADRVGKVQAAEKGTLFLDEIGELPPEIQPKLLRLLQEKTYERVGDPTERTADVRVIAATNRDLDEEVRAGRFRRDLYERLNFVPIRIPPLRERREDIPLLLLHCLREYDAGRWVEISDETAEFLRSLDFAWPGNVRHLEHLSARLALEPPDGPVTPADVRRLLDTSATSGEPGSASSSGESDLEMEMGLPALLAHEERKWLQKALERHPELTRADLAAKLKISEAALYKKLRMYHLSG